VPALSFRRRIAILVTLLTVEVAALAGATLGGKTAADGFMLDAEVAARARVLPPDATRQPVAVVAMDERSLDAPELADTPRILFAPFWGKLLDGLFAAKAKSAGFDILFSFSANHLIPNYDEPFLSALNRHKTTVVLGQSLDAQPAPPFQFAVGAMEDATALGVLEISPDADGVYRHIPSGWFDQTGNFYPSFADALLERAGYPRLKAPVLVAPDRDLEALPTYSLIDVLRCAATNPALVEDRFHDRVVLIGTTLPDEDRKESAGRFLPPPSVPATPESATGCSLEQQPVSVPGASTVPGVYLHAGAIAEAATGRLVRQTPPALVAGTAGLCAVLGAVLGFNVSLLAAAAGVVVALALIFVIGTALLLHLVWLPVAIPMIAVAGSLAFAYAARFGLESRLRRMFGVFVSKEIINRLAQSDGLELGGETRRLTIMFADLSPFTEMSTRLPSHELLALTNEYLQIMVDEIDRNRGYVDKFIGDAVMAFWNAPDEDPEHSVHAVEAALAIARRIAEKSANTPEGEPRFRAVKIGIETGPATVGNVGSLKRANYTAVGETVNIAARLESIPARYACAIVLGESVAEVVGRRFLLRELDTTSLRGRAQPIRLFEPICPVEDADERLRVTIERYETALASYRAGRYAEACRLWTELTEKPESEILNPGPASKMAAIAAEKLPAESLAAS
jgi:class 3 adenylate cyclase